MATAVRRFTLAAALAFTMLAAVPARAQVTCDDTAQKAATDAKTNGLPPLQVDRAYGAALLTCKGVTDTGLAAVAAAANLDRARLARLFLARKLATSDYLALVRDRSGKLRLARNDLAYRTAFLAGDADGDLVPDDRDKCKQTRDLAETGRDGCPVRPGRRQGPSEDAMQQARRALKGVALVSNPKCAEAPVPDRSILLHQGFLRPDGNPANHFYGVSVSRVRNVPAGCEGFYQFNFRFTDRTDALFPVTKIIQVTFADGDNTDTGPKSAVRRIFKVFQADTGHRQDLFRSAVKYGLVEWRVRTVGANGLMSTWSDWRHEAFNGVFRPNVP
ncbi:MAG: hypothetical protein H0W08_27340 [Acidobacteria bacterium]|nr:hypothetical protein [Acidobacteriota bacterium]